MEDGERNQRGAAPRIPPGKLTALLEELAANPRGEPGSAWDPVLRPGASVGRFELLREVGRGGFGVVWEARDTELGRAVAFKAVRPGEEGGQYTERLLREAEAAARLSHPNIVTLYDVGRAEQGPYLVLEFLRGETLEDRLVRGPLSPRESLRIAAEIAKGVAHAHERGVVHRDLKPANVFLCDDDQVKVLDFGLAHAFGRRPAEGGTSGYMAPEQAEGAPEDERTDVYALGVILHRMMTGDPPDAARGGAGREALPELVVREVPALGPFIQRMIARRAAERPRDGEEVLAALSAFRAELEGAGSSAPVEKRRRAGTRRLWLPLAILAISGAGGAAAWRLAKGGAPTDPNPSVAVLPFADLSPQHDQEYFADGIAEEILDALAHVDGLRVPGRTSSFYFRGKNVELVEIGRRLGVKHVVEGSVRRAGERVRITAKLVDVAGGYQLWSDTFDGDVGQIFDVQARFAKSVARALRVKLLPESVSVTSPTANDEAHLEYLRGRALFYTGQRENVERAVKHFELAVALDPGYAPAWAWLSCSIVEIDWFSRRSTPESQERALAAVEKAIALAPDDAVGYLSRSNLRAAVLWDWDGARTDMERALALKKRTLDTPDAYHQHGVLLAMLGRAREAIAVERIATEIDPLNAGYWGSLGAWYLDAGEIGPARAALVRSRELSPDRYGFRLGVAEMLAGSPREALATFESLPAEDLRLAGVAMAQHALGDREESRRSFERLVARHGAGMPYDVAVVHAWRGEIEEAFAWLQRAYDRRDLWLARLKSDPLLRNLRHDPRYTALLAKMKLPVD